MFQVDYNRAINEIVEFSPDLERASLFFSWAETVVDVLQVVYPQVDSDTAMEDLVKAAKEYQEFEDEEK